MAGLANVEPTTYSRGKVNQLCRNGTGKGRCLKCCQVGDVLVCSGNDCPTVVHESCMSCPAQFDDMGSFYCPYCLYKRYLRECRQAKRRTSLAKEALSTFLDVSIVAGTQHKKIAEGPERKKAGFSPVEKQHDRGNTHKKGTKIDGENNQPVQVGKDARDLICASQVNQNVSLDEKAKILTADKQEKALKTRSNDMEIPSQCGNDLISTKNQMHLDRSNCENLLSKEAYRTTKRRVATFVTTPQVGEGNVSREVFDWEFGGSKERNLKHYRQDGCHENKNAANDRQQTLPVDYCQSEKDKDAHELELLKNIRKAPKQNQNGTEYEKQISLRPPTTAGCPIRNEVLADMQEGTYSVEETSSSCQNDYIIRYRTPTKQRSQDSDDCRDVDQSRKSLMTSVQIIDHEIDQAVTLGKSRPYRESFKAVNKSLALPSQRRAKLAWRVEEEEMLKEAVGKFSFTVSKNIPWSKILDFGRHVFDGTRTPVDLKDKWKNLVAKRRRRNHA